MSFLKMCYYIVAGIAFITLINDIWILRWHSWDRHLFGWLPVGGMIGWFEVMALTALASASAMMALKELKGGIQMDDFERFWEDFTAQEKEKPLLKKVVNELTA